MPPFLTKNVTFLPPKFLMTFFQILPRILFEVCRPFFHCQNVRRPISLVVNLEFHFITPFTVNFTFSPLPWPLAECRPLLKVPSRTSRPHRPRYATGHMSTTLYHHCTFSFITAHSVHHCTLKHALLVFTVETASDVGYSSIFIFFVTPTPFSLL